MTTLYIDDSPCGSGKTYRALEEIAVKPRRTVFAVSQRCEAYDRAVMLRAIAEALGIEPPHIAFIFADREERIAHRIETIPVAFATYASVVVFVCHAGLKVSDLSKFGGHGWRLVIDEDPKAWTSQTLNLAAPHAIDELFDLEPLAGVKGFSRVRARSLETAIRVTRDDDLYRPLAPMVQQVRSGEVVASLTNWDQIRPGEGEVRKLTWSSTWPVTALSGFSRVTILASGFAELLTYKFWRTQAECHFLQPPRSAQCTQRDLEVRYFLDQAVTSSAIKSGSLRAVLEAANEIIPTNHGSDLFWAANNFNTVSALPGQRISPCASGSNAFSHLSACAFLFTAKASAAEIRALQAFHGPEIGHDTIRRDREYEPLIQFAMRSALRDPESTKPVTLYVLDRDQAEWLRSYFTGGSVRVATSKIETGAAVSEKKKKIAMSAAERAKAYRDRQRAARTAAE